jgi:hypothetical protein
MADWKFYSTRKETSIIIARLGAIFTGRGSTHLLMKDNGFDLPGFWGF